ncbi:hypothetical protein C6P40_000902 [Pichia californica]|uniref:DNA polymerase delta subunit 3 n=1 Tax=Pichia californica TaxID=460514 RepID=A0A9P6WLT1_9ASCO|nr:hypothetical protein C6P40_000902 [[Candida] californica]
MGIDFIEKSLNIDERPITSIWLSRKLMISSNTASEFMLNFYNKYKDKESINKNILIKYIICGKQKFQDIKNERHADILIKIVNKDELDETIKNIFSDIISCQIYSMQLNNNNNNVSISNIIDLCKIPNWNYTDDNMIKCGILRTNTNGVLKNVIEDVDQQDEKDEGIKSRNRATTEPVKPIKSIKKEETNRPVYVSRKASSNPIVKPDIKKPVYVSRKRQNEEDKPMSVKKSKTSIKQQKQIQEEEDKKEEEKKELEKMLEDDDNDNFSDGVVADVENEDIQPSKKYEHDDIDVADPEDSVEIIDSNNVTKSNSKPLEKDIEDIFSDDDDEFLNKELNKNESKDESKKSIEIKPDVETYVDSDGYVVRKVNRVPSKPISSTSNRNFTIETNSSKDKSSTTSKKQKEFTGARSNEDHIEHGTLVHNDHNDQIHYSENDETDEYSAMTFEGTNKSYITNGSFKDSGRNYNLEKRCKYHTELIVCPKFNEHGFKDSIALIPKLRGSHNFMEWFNKIQNMVGDNFNMNDILKEALVYLNSKSSYIKQEGCPKYDSNINQIMKSSIPETMIRKIILADMIRF